MKRLFSALVILNILAVLGCDEKVTLETTSKNDKVIVVKPADQTFVRGATNDVDVTITRKEYAKPVQVSFDDLPKGVTVVETREIAGDQSKVTYKLKIAGDAEIVEKRAVYVTVTGPDGVKTRETFNVTVKEH